MDGSAASFIAQNLSVTDGGMVLLIILAFAAQWWHARDCQHRRKGFHETDAELRGDMKEVKNDLKWIKRHMGAGDD